MAGEESGNAQAPLNPGVIITARPWHDGRQLDTATGYVVAGAPPAPGADITAWFPGKGTFEPDDGKPSAVQGFHAEEVTVTGDLRNEPIGVTQQLHELAQASGSHSDRQRIDSMITLIAQHKNRAGRITNIRTTDGRPAYLEEGQDYYLRYREEGQHADRVALMRFTGQTAGCAEFSVRGDGTRTISIGSLAEARWAGKDTEKHYGPRTVTSQDPSRARARRNRPASPGPRHPGP